MTVGLSLNWRCSVAIPSEGRTRPVRSRCPSVVETARRVTVPVVRPDFVR